MKAEDLNMLAQLVESMGSVAERLESELEKRNIEKVQIAKGEPMNFQRQIDKIIGKI